MTVVRALILIDAFDKLEKDQDWTDVPSTAYRKVFDDRYTHHAEIIEMWNRYKTLALHDSVLRLADNLVLEGLSAKRRKEITNGLNKLRIAIGE